MRQEIIGNATLYLGDCRDIIPTVGQIGAVVTDPPYGIGKWSSSGGNSLSTSETETISNWDVAPSDDLFRMIRACSKEQIFWGGNYFNLGRCPSPLIWDKKIRGMHYADGEFAWTSFKTGTLRIFEMALQSTEVRELGREHPTQKPVLVMEWCLQQLPDDAMVILDPFMGSGTTGVAAMNMKRKFIGIEKHEPYFDICCRRITEAQKQEGLF